MTYDKKKYVIKPSYGVGNVTTEPLYGLIRNLVVEPKSKSTIWSMSVYDRDNDIIFQRLDQEGVKSYTDGIPVGKDKQEALKLVFDELTSNEEIKVIFNIQEQR